MRLATFRDAHSSLPAPQADIRRRKARHVDQTSSRGGEVGDDHFADLLERAAP